MEDLVLGMLKVGPAHGYELRERVREELGPAWRVASSQLYLWLRRLEEGGFVRGRSVPSLEGPPRVEYALTPLGEERFTAWLRSGSLSSRRARGAHLVRLYFVLRFAPELLPAYVDQERAALERRRLRLRAQDTGGDPFREAVRALRLHRVAGGLKWLAELCPPKEER